MTTEGILTLGALGANALIQVARLFVGRDRKVLEAQHGADARVTDVINEDVCERLEKIEREFRANTTQVHDKINRYNVDIGRRIDSMITRIEHDKDIKHLEQMIMLRLGGGAGL